MTEVVVLTIIVITDEKLHNQNIFYCELVIKQIFFQHLIIKNFNV